MKFPPFTPRALPVRPSLDSLRRQAKALVRKLVAEDEEARARVRAQLPNWEPPLSVRDAQLVVARERNPCGAVFEEDATACRK